MAKAAKKKKQASKGQTPLLKSTRTMEGRSPNDTLRLWENYREQALLWRALALLQVPTTLVLTLFAMNLWDDRIYQIHVPPDPLPGFYTTESIPDQHFVARAQEFVNLIASYQPTNAKDQYTKAAEYLIEPVLTKFVSEFMKSELRTIETTRRTQIYWTDPEKTSVTRDRSTGDVTVNFSGERRKMVAGKEIPDVRTTFAITMTTIPRNPLNEYGIVIKDIETKSTELQYLKKR